MHALLIGPPPPCLPRLQREKEEAARERADANARVQALLSELQAERANSAGLEVRAPLHIAQDTPCCHALLAAAAFPATILTHGTCAPG